MKSLKIITMALISGFMFCSAAGAGENISGEQKKHHGEKIMKVTEEIEKIIVNFREKLESEPQFKEHIYFKFDLNKDGKLSNDEIKNAIILDRPVHMRGQMMPPPPPFGEGMNGHRGPFPGMYGGFPPPPPCFGQGNNMMPPPPPFGESMNGHRGPFPGMYGGFPPPPPCFGQGNNMMPPPPPFGEGMNGHRGPNPGMMCCNFDGKFKEPKIEDIIGRIKEKMDREPEFKEHMLAMFDTNKDGKLSDDEIKNSLMARRFGRMMPPPPPFGEGMNGHRGPFPGMYGGFPPPPPFGEGMNGRRGPHPGMMCCNFDGKFNVKPNRFQAFGRGPKAGWWNKNNMLNRCKEFDDNKL
ncbi:MAG TPA: hypothetical protein PKK26_12150, partial [Candidatus Wallbacteria bacterium]|nr:hypothetical protein [Candidatus Wallbacteria bacterium]